MADQYIVKSHNLGMLGSVSEDKVEQELNEIATNENLELVSFAFLAMKKAISVWKKKA